MKRLRINYSTGCTESSIAKDRAGCSAFVGHSKMSITLDYYTKYLPTENESPAKVMSEIIKKANQ